MPMMPSVAVVDSGAEQSGLDEALVERRHHPRFPTNLSVEAWWQDEFGYPCARAAVVKDASVGGFGLELDAKPPIGALLRVRTEESSLRCVVRHVHCRDGRFRVGVEVLVASNTCAASTKSLARLAAVLSEAGRVSRLSKTAR